MRKKLGDTPYCPTLLYENLKYSGSKQSYTFESDLENAVVYVAYENHGGGNNTGSVSCTGNADVAFLIPDRQLTFNFMFGGQVPNIGNAYITTYLYILKNIKAGDSITVSSDQNLYYPYMYFRIWG